jgi:hypothetical protein
MAPATQRGSAGIVILVILVIGAVVGMAMPQLGVPVFADLGCRLRGAQYVEFFGAKGCIDESDF